MIKTRIIKSQARLISFNLNKEPRLKLFKRSLDDCARASALENKTLFSQWDCKSDYWAIFLSGRSVASSYKLRGLLYWKLDWRISCAAFGSSLRRYIKCFDIVFIRKACFQNLRTLSHSKQAPNNVGTRHVMAQQTISIVTRNHHNVIKNKLYRPFLSNQRYSDLRQQ